MEDFYRELLTEAENKPKPIVPTAPSRPIGGKKKHRSRPKPPPPMLAQSHREYGQPYCKMEPRSPENPPSQSERCEYYANPIYREWEPEPVPYGKVEYYENKDPMRAIHPNEEPLEIRVPTTPKSAPMAGPVFMSPQYAQQIGQQGGQTIMPKASNWNPPEPPEYRPFPKHPGPPQLVQFMTGQEMGEGMATTPLVQNQMEPASGLSLRLCPIWVLSQQNKEEGGKRTVRSLRRRAGRLRPTNRW